MSQLLWHDWPTSSCDPALKKKPEIHFWLGINYSIYYFNQIKIFVRKRKCRQPVIFSCQISPTWINSSVLQTYTAVTRLVSASWAAFLDTEVKEGVWQDQFLHIQTASRAVTALFLQSVLRGSACLHDCLPSVSENEEADCRNLLAWWHTCDTWLPISPQNYPWLWEVYIPPHGGEQIDWPAWGSRGWWWRRLGFGGVVDQ